MSLFEDALSITLSSFTKADGSGLIAADMQVIADGLRESGFASRLAVEINRHPAKLADGSVYVTYSNS